jgi:hypothetical protein
VIDSHVRRRYQDQLGVRERIEATSPVVVPDARGSHPPVRYRFEKQENVGLIHSATAERKRLQHSVDRLLVAAEYVTGEWLGNDLIFARSWPRSDRQDRQKRPEDFILHDFVGPRHGIQNARVEVTGLSIELSTINYLLGIDQGCKPVYRGIPRQG